MKKLAFFTLVMCAVGMTSFGHINERPNIATGQAQEPIPKPKPPDSAVRWPKSETPAMPVPQIVTKLSAEQLYVVEWDKDFFLLASPANLVKVTRETGPITMRGVFADGNGKVQTRKYKGPFVSIVEAAGTGPAELLAVPSGLTDEAQVIRKTVDVDSGAGPRPPPGPNPPGPNPPTPAPIPLDGFRVLIVYDPSTLTDAQDGIITGKAVRDYLQAKCVVGADGKTKDFWILQTGSDVSNAPKWIGDAIQRRPDRKTFMLVSDGKTGYDGVIPATKDAAMVELKKVGG